MKVFIGVGHGGRDPGAVGLVRESEANLNMALGMKEELEKHGIVVGISRTTEADDSLAEEIMEANEFEPDVAVEVHNNAGRGKGFEVYVQTNSFGEQSQKLARSIEEKVEAHGQNSRGLKIKKNGADTDYFGWLRRVNAPSVLCEGFFVDNAEDCAQFDTEEKQKEYGRVYALGVLDYLGINPDEEKPPKISSYYSVQTGSFLHKRNAERMKNKLYPDYDTVFILHCQESYRVCVGKFSDRKEAELQKKELAEQGYRSFIKRFKEEIS